MEIMVRIKKMHTVDFRSLKYYETPNPIYSVITAGSYLYLSNLNRPVSTINGICFRFPSSTILGCVCSYPYFIFECETYSFYVGSSHLYVSFFVRYNAYISLPFYDLLLFYMSFNCISSEVISFFINIICFNLAKIMFFSA